MNLNTFTETITTHLPPNTALRHAILGFTATWTTPKGIWRIDVNPFTGAHIQGPGLALHTDNPDAILTTLRALGALPAAPDPHATIRQLAKELTAIDSFLTGAGVDVRGAQGVAALAGAYRDLIQTADNKGHGSHDDARILVAEAAKLLAQPISANADEATDDDVDAWTVNVQRWLEMHEAFYSGVALSDLRYSDMTDEQPPTPAVHEDADPGRPADMMPATDHLMIPPTDPFAMPKANGGIYTGGPLVGNGAGCVIDIQEPNRAINPEYRAAIQRELDQAKPIQQA